MILPLSTYNFVYTITDDTVSIAFSDDATNDADCTFSVDGDTLTLISNSGTEYRMTKEG